MYDCRNSFPGGERRASDGTPSPCSCSYFLQVDCVHGVGATSASSWSAVTCGPSPEPQSLEVCVIWNACVACLPFWAEVLGVRVSSISLSPAQGMSFHQYVPNEKVVAVLHNLTAPLMPMLHPHYEVPCWLLICVPACIAECSSVPGSFPAFLHHRHEDLFV